MKTERNSEPTLFDRGIVMLSIDTERMWGYFDHLTETAFLRRFPRGIEAHWTLLNCLCAAELSATWFVVGGLALSASDGASDRRVAGLPAEWTSAIPSGDELTKPLWYGQRFIKSLRDASPQQEIGLHAGLTHLIWTDTRMTRDVMRRELREGLKALQSIGVRPLAFSFAREQEGCHELLPPCGIRTFRGSIPSLSWRLGQTLSGAVMRLSDECFRRTPPLTWPSESLPGLWNIPSSQFLYPIGPSRARLVSIHSRIERFRRALQSAARRRGIFHFSFHPENLAESPCGFSLLDELLEHLTRVRDRGDIEVLTMRQVVALAERARDQGLTVAAGLSATTG